MLQSHRSRRLISLMPKDRILLETDGPFGTLKGQILEPPDVYYMAQYLGNVWDLPDEEVSNQLKKNLMNILQEN